MHLTKRHRAIMKAVRSDKTFAWEAMICMEECSELITAMSHSLRGRKADIETEVADVFIMVQQIGSYLDQKKIQAEIDYKLNRVLNRTIEERRKNGSSK